MLPIVHRELLLASKRHSTYWTRCATAGLIGGILFGLGLSANEPLARLSPILFWVAKALTFAYCLFAGVRYTADALSEERREGTLGLLFLTNLHGYDVVLGKMAIRSLNACFGFVAVIPILAIPVMMGGVTPAEFWRTVLVMANTLLFSLAIGLMISAFGLQERNVMLATLVTLLGITFGFPLLCDSLGPFRSGWLDILLLFPSPAYALQISASGLFVTVRSDFWPCMLSILGLSMACVLGASLRLPRSLAEPSTNSGHQELGAVGDHPWQNGSVVTRCTDNSHPYYWRLNRDRSMIHWGLLLVTLIILFGLYSLATIPLGGSRVMKPSMVFGWLAAHWIIKFLLASEACRWFNEDKRIGALELLLATPLQPQAMLDAYGRRLWRVFALPITAVCFINLLLSSATGDKVIDSGFFWGALLLPADCWALCWTSMHSSLASRSFTVAVVTSLWRVLIFPLLALFALFLLLMTSSVSQDILCVCLSAWAVGVLIYDVWLAGWKRLTVMAGFRRLAAG